jgi:beta-fructofuranosidase
MTDESLYSGRLIRDRAGRWVMLAFRNRGPDGSFVGELTDPMPIRWATDGSALQLIWPEPAESQRHQPPSASPSAHP